MAVVVTEVRKAFKVHRVLKVLLVVAVSLAVVIPTTQAKAFVLAAALSLWKVYEAVLLVNIADGTVALGVVTRIEAQVAAVAVETMSMLAEVSDFLAIL